MTQIIPTKLYCITNTANGKLYAGITSRELSVRWNEHMKAYKGQQRAYSLHHAMRKHGPDKFTIETLFEYPSEDAAAAAEIQLIACMRLTRLGYNAGPGGDLSPTQGVGHSEEVRAKISERARKQFSTPESREILSARARRQMSDPAAREKISASLRGRKRPDISARMRGRKLSASHVALLKTANTGIVRSEDTLARMSAAQYKRWSSHRDRPGYRPTDSVIAQTRDVVYSDMGMM